MWKKGIAHYIYEIALSAYCALIFLVMETQGVRSIYDPVLRLLGWGHARWFQSTIWGLVGLTAFVFFLLTSLFSLYAPVRRLLWRGTGLVVLAGYFFFWRCRSGGPHPAAIVLISLETIAIVAIYFAGWQARARRIGTALKILAVVLHFSFWAWLDWSDFSDLDVLIANSGVLVCPVLGAALGIMWVLDVGRE